MVNNRKLHHFAQSMKRDWDERAAQDAKWFINSLKLGQSEAEFDQTGVVEVERLVLADLPLLTQERDPQSLHLLEIGCGAGRMTKHLAARFGRVDGVDVSGEMIRQAQARLAGVGNVHLHETSGVDFARFADETFDLILSAYVFQHVPSAAVIESNLREAWRVLKPGGVFKFQTNSVISPAFEQAEKDTWAGATFPASAIRAFARETGAQLISLFGAGTQYCWTTLRKRANAAAGTSETAPLRLEFFGRTVEASNRQIPVEGDQASLTVIVSGLDREQADCNSVSAVIGGVAVEARYVGPVGNNFAGALQAAFGDRLARFTQVEIGIPPGLAPGLAEVTVQAGEINAVNAIAVELISARPAPKLGTIMNACDHGTDIHARGPKSRLKVLVEGLDETAGVANVAVRIGAAAIRPERVTFHPGNAIYELELQLPAAIAPGAAELSVQFGARQSPAATIQIIGAED